MTKWTLSDRGRKAEIILAENPYDVDAWGVLLREAQVGQIFFIMVLMLHVGEKHISFPVP